MTAPLAKFALGEFARRRAALRDGVAKRQITADDANHKAQVWLAIARATGADCPEMYIECLWPRGRKTRLTAYEIADWQECVHELARASRYAANRAGADPQNLKAQQRAWDLEALAVHHGLTPDYAMEKQEAA